MVRQARAVEDCTWVREPDIRKSRIPPLLEPGVACVGGATVHRSRGCAPQCSSLQGAGFNDHVEIITSHSDGGPIAADGRGSADTKESRSPWPPSDRHISEVDARDGGGGVPHDNIVAVEPWVRGTDIRQSIGVRPRTAGGSPGRVGSIEPIESILLTSGHS